MLNSCRENFLSATEQFQLTVIHGDEESGVFVVMDIRRLAVQ